MNIKYLRLFFFLLSGFYHPAYAVFGVGLHSLRFADSNMGVSIQGMVFYPAKEISGHTVLTNGMRIDGVYDVKPETGKYPLIVISHGNLGSLWGHHDLASMLVRAGYIVATLDHAGDSAKDSSKIGTPEVFVGRPRQLSALISAVLANTQLSALIDQNRIGAIGFSLGSYTVLTAAGARPNFTLIDDYCRQPHALAFCENREMIRSILLPPDLTDLRIKAIVALAPFGIFFDNPGLKKLKRPVLLYTAENDQELLPAYNAERVRQGLPTNTPYIVIPKAGHFIFLAPCSEIQAKRKPALCHDAIGINRQQIHQDMVGRIIRFFEQELRF